MKEDNIIGLFIRDFRLGVQKHQEAIKFIRDHKLWVGFWKYGWASRFLLFLGFLIGLKYMSILNSWWQQSDMSDPIHFTSSVGSLFRDVAVESYNLFFLSSIKYFILILMEILIFHFARKTLEILRGIKVDATFNTFVNAEIRMIKVVIFAYVMEMIFTFGASIVLEIVGFEFLKPVLSILIQSFFLGFVVIDNYNEIFGMKIKESLEYTHKFMGLAISMGLVTYVLLLLPLLGAFVAPLLGGVTATLAMDHLTRLDDHFVLE